MKDTPGKPVNEGHMATERLNKEKVAHKRLVNKINATNNKH